MAQSEDERKTLENELDRMKEYTQLFSVRLEEISSDVDQVESLKKSAIKEEHQYNQLSKIAQNLRNEIYNLEDNFKTTVEDTQDKVNDSYHMMLPSLNYILWLLSKLSYFLLYSISNILHDSIRLK